LIYVDLGLWTARRAGISSDRIVNWLALSELREVFG